MSQRDGLAALVARAGSAALAVNVMAAGLGYLLNILLARVMGPAAYGDYVYALAWATLLGLFCTSGLDAAALRFLAAYVGTEHWGAARGFLQRAVQVVAGTSLVVTAIYLGSLLVARTKFEPELLRVLAFAAPLLFINAFVALAGRILQSLRRVVLADAPNKILRPVLLGSAVVTLYVLRSASPSAVEVMILNALMALAVLLVLIRFVRRVIPHDIRRADPAFRTREWLLVGVPLLLLSGLHVVIARTDLLMIGALMGTTDAGIYAAGARTAELTGFGLIAVNAIAAPLIAAQHARGEAAGLQRTITLAARGSAAFALVSAVVLVAGGNWILGLFGETFRAGYVPLVVLVAGQVISAFVGSVGYLMTMTGHEREVTVVVGGAALLNVTLNFFLIPIYGLVGAAVATSVSLALWNIVLAIQVKRRLDVVPTALGGTFEESEEIR